MVGSFVSNRVLVTKIARADYAEALIWFNRTTASDKRFPFKKAKHRIVSYTTPAVYVYSTVAGLILIGRSSNATFGRRSVKVTSGHVIWFM